MKHALYRTGTDLFYYLPVTYTPQKSRQGTMESIENPEIYDDIQSIVGFLRSCCFTIENVCTYVCMCPLSTSVWLHLH